MNAEPVKNNNLELFDVIITYPLLKAKFENVGIISRIEASILSIGSPYHKIYGSRYLLIGNAASLAEPITGQGIGNALLSGKLALVTIKKCFLNSNFPKQEFKCYKIKIYKYLYSKLLKQKIIQFILKTPFILNFLINKISKKPKLRDKVKQSINNSLIHFLF